MLCKKSHAHAPPLRLQSKDIFRNTALLMLVRGVMWTMKMVSFPYWALQQENKLAMAGLGK